MKKKNRFVFVHAAMAIVVVALALSATAVHAQDQAIVFQAAGPTPASIQSTVDAFRAALGEPNNGNAAGPLATGRREINWDGGGSNATTPPQKPFNVFLNTRGSQTNTPGEGLAQAPAEFGLNGGLGVLFNNPSYANIFKAFSPVRLFTPVGSRITDGVFFIPGTNGTTPAAVAGFGVVFTDVDKPNGKGKHPTRIEFFDAQGNSLFIGLVPSSPGDGSQSFFGIVFPDARIARVRIKTGEAKPGVDDTEKDIVMMDDFLYSEPQPLP